MINALNIFETNFATANKNIYTQFKIKNDSELFSFLKNFISVEEWCQTPYKHKSGYYNKKSHYINGTKVNRQVYKYVKNWLESEKVSITNE